MQLNERLEKAWFSEGRYRNTYQRLTFTENGLEIGNGTVVVKLARDEWDRPALAVDGEEERILALLSVAWEKPIPDWVIDHFRSASRALSKGEITQAYIHIAYTGLQPLMPDPETLRLLFFAEGFLDAGISGNEIRKAWGLGESNVFPQFRLHSSRRLRKDENFEQKHPRTPEGCTGGGEFCDSAGALFEKAEPPNNLPKDQLENWNKFKDALKARKDLTDTERYAYLKTFGWEGGMKLDPNGGGDGIPSKAGITETTLPNLGIGTGNVNNLTMDQVINGYKAISAGLMKNKETGLKLDDLGNPKVAAQCFDTYFQLSLTSSTNVVQNAINDTIKQATDTDKKRYPLEPIEVETVKKDENGKTTYQPTIGKADRTAIQRLVKAGLGKKLQQALADRRAVVTGKNGSNGERYSGYQ